MLLYYLSLVDTEEEKSKLENLYYEYKALMKYIAFNILGDNGLAEDAVHEAFIKLTRHLDGIGEIKSLKTKAFIVIIIRCVALDMLDKKKRNKIYSFDDIGNKAITEDTMIESIELKELCSLIKALPAIHRDIIELKVYYELSDKEISDILGISRQAVRKRLQRARNALKQSLEKLGVY